ncbi:MAG: glycosyltransferase [Limisphaerales bacterium]
MDNDSLSRPLVSFVVLGYRQEACIREAIEGAFAQTYSPLEIILTDDCSPDRTFEIMQEMAASYRGAARIVLNRNPRNLLVVRHFNRIMELASGELIIAAAGDDVSVPERAARLVDAWVQGGRKRVLLTSGFEVTDELGKALSASAGRPGKLNAEDPVSAVRACLDICGATHAWHRDVFHNFGPFVEKRPAEDSFLFLRACLLDGIIVVHENLLRYRARRPHSSLKSLRKGELFQRRSFPPAFRQWRRDLSAGYAARKYGTAGLRRALAEVERLRKRSALRYLAEKADNPPNPPWRAIRMALLNPVLLAEGTRLLLQKVAPWLWRWRRAVRSVSRTG